MLSELQQGPSANEMRAFAYRLLGRREYGIRELCNRIRKKWPEAEGIEALVEQLATENLVSDERFAESFVRSRVRRQQGPLKIKAELSRKGVPDASTSRALDSVAGQWLEIAAQWLQKQHPGDIGFEDKQKFYRRLVNRGFTHDQAMDVLKRSR